MRTKWKRGLAAVCITVILLSTGNISEHPPEGDYPPEGDSERIAEVMAELRAGMSGSKFERE